MYRPAATPRSSSAGDVTPDTHRCPCSRSTSATWADRRARRRAAVPRPPQLTARRVDHRRHARAREQSQIRIGWVGVPRSTPDYFTLQVLNTVLGGSFTSRLNQNLREEHGYSYGASSRFDMRLSAGAFAAGAGVQTDKTAESLRGVLQGAPADCGANRRRLSSSDGQELRRARLPRRVRDDPRPLRTPRRVDRLRAAGQLLRAVRGPSIQAVTVEGLRKAAATYIQPDKSQWSSSAIAKAIEPVIRALDLGPVRVISVDEGIGQ